MFEPSERPDRAATTHPARGDCVHGWTRPSRRTRTAGRGAAGACGRRRRRTRHSGGRTRGRATRLCGSPVGRFQSGTLKGLLGVLISLANLCTEPLVIDNSNK